jgi:hypothetical protein
LDYNVQTMPTDVETAARASMVAAIKAAAEGMVQGATAKAEEATSRLQCR